MITPDVIAEGSLPMEGIRIIELAEWTFVPSASMVLAELGADVLKIEHPVRGDAQHGLITPSADEGRPDVNLLMAQTNRGKRSIGIDFQKPEGRDLVAELVESADVFLTSLRAPALRRAGLDSGTLRSQKPDLIYARGHGQGASGPDAHAPAYDTTAYWARSGLSHLLTSTAETERPVQSRPAMGDRAGSMNLAFGIAAALLRRERTGEGALVDVSLLATGMWTISSDLVFSAANPGQERAFLPQPNPLVRDYQTADGFWIAFAMIASDRWWPQFCDVLQSSEISDNPRFRSSADRSKHESECVDAIQNAIGAHTLAVWEGRLEDFDGPWAAVQTLDQVLADPQVAANSYVAEVAYGDQTVKVVPAPVQFEGVRRPVSRPPEPWEHTEEILLDLGHSWEQLAKLKEAGVIA